MVRQFIVPVTITQYFPGRKDTGHRDREFPMPKKSLAEYRDFYRAFLLDDILPYWDRHGLDREYGGFLNCMKDDGTVLSEDKYMWSQGRGLWTFAHVLGRYDDSPGMREFVTKTCRFLAGNAVDGNGDFANRLSRDGRRLDGPTSIYSDMFTSMGLIEYHRVTGERDMLELARSTAHRIAHRIRQPDFDAVAPFKLRPGHHLQGVLFLSLNMLTPLLGEIDDPDLEKEADRCIRHILDDHMDRERRLNIETLGPDWKEVEYPQGRDYVPGHGVECAWILMLEAKRRGDDSLMNDAMTILRWHLEKGWDEEKGGLFWWLDIDGGEPFEQNWMYKLWWPHSESLLGLTLAHEFGGGDWCMEWFEKMHDYSFATFTDRENGEWKQRLDREGNPVTKTLVLPVKDPFHLPRAVMWIIESMERRVG